MLSNEDIDKIISILKQRFILIERNGSFDPADKEKQTELIRVISNITAGLFGIEPEKYKTKSRGWGLPTQRGLICKAVREISEKKVSFDHVARFFNQDHATMVHGNRRVDGLISVDPSVANDYQIIINTYNRIGKLTN